jgi:hypothetical protein
MNPICARVGIALALFASGIGHALAAQPGHAPAPPARHLDEYTYQRALSAVWNFQSCGTRGRPAAHAALDAELQSLEAMARAKGLGPLLERVRSEYQRMLSVALIMPCAGGPAAALARAHQALAAFRAWVAAKPQMPPP